MKKILIFVIILIIIILFISIKIFIKNESFQINPGIQIIEKEEILEEFSKYEEKYEGNQNGEIVKKIIFKIYECFPILIKEKIQLPIITLQSEEKVDIKFEDDIDNYRQNLNNLITSINNERYYNVKISSDLKGYPLEIIIEE